MDRGKEDDTIAAAKHASSNTRKDTSKDRDEKNEKGTEVCDERETQRERGGINTEQRVSGNVFDGSRDSSIVRGNKGEDEEEEREDEEAAEEANHDSESSDSTEEEEGTGDEEEENTRRTEAGSREAAEERVEGGGIEEIRRVENEPQTVQREASVQNDSKSRSRESGAAVCRICQEAEPSSSNR